MGTAKRCTGCNDPLNGLTAVLSRVDRSTPICGECGTFESAARAVGDFLVSPGHAVSPGKPAREQFNRRTSFLR